ncbi:hypothetical protein KKE92_05960 [Candidatus Micrarchaeota archaeon]|nr:hypothetical protein [Candidatus Micrarchaeota archaeon]MBU1681600.1 hypothetical protein [Candidatus Micrarchaeota archaeon]
MREEESVRMVSRVMGIQGQLGRVYEKPINVEILSVGPHYRETDYRSIYAELAKTPFGKKIPM